MKLQGKRQRDRIENEMVALTETYGVLFEFISWTTPKHVIFFFQYYLCHSEGR